MATATKAMYDRLMQDRPFKFSGIEVDYRDAEDEKHCGDCVHFYERKIDSHHTCEIFRPDDDESVDPAYVCDFFSADGGIFPLLP